MIPDYDRDPGYQHHEGILIIRLRSHMDKTVQDRNSSAYRSFHTENVLSFGANRRSQEEFVEIEMFLARKRPSEAKSGKSARFSPAGSLCALLRSTPSNSQFSATTVDRAGLAPAGQVQMGDVPSWRSGVVLVPACLHLPPRQPPSSSHDQAMSVRRTHA